MKYLKKFNEMLDPMGSWNPKQLKDKEQINPNNQEVMFHEERKEYFYEDIVDGRLVTIWLGKDYIPDAEVCEDCYCTPCQCDDLMDDELERELKEAKDEKKNLLDYFMDMSNEELMEYEKNFKHSFEDPQHHNPEYVAYKTACRLKRVFMSK